MNCRDERQAKRQKETKSTLPTVEGETGQEKIDPTREPPRRQPGGGIGASVAASASGTLTETAL